MQRHHPPSTPKAVARGKARRKRNRTSARHLDNVLSKGAVIRPHKFFADLRRLVVPALIAGLLQCFVYAGVILLADRRDWGNLAVVCALLMFMPLAAAIVISGLRTREFPFTLAAVLMGVVFNFGVVILSAMRIPISYTGLFLAAPFAIGGMIVAATRLTRMANERLALLDFPGAVRVADVIGGDLTIVAEEKADLSDFDRILIDGESHLTSRWNSHLTRAQMRGILVQPWFFTKEEKWGRVDLEHFDITHLAYRPTQIYYTRIKRFLDVLLVCLTVPVTAPLGALIWLYIRAIDGKPGLFVQTRRGYGGNNFRMLKFRTMRRGSHGGATDPADNRILPGCSVIRKLRLDELPQLINIVRGEMSWIGPRPVSLEIARKCEAASPVYTARYLVLPGITGWAQIQYGYAGDVEQELEKLEYDLYYLKRISLDLDLEITFRTLRVLVTGTGAR